MLIVYLNVIYCLTINNRIRGGGEGVQTASKWAEILHVIQKPTPATKWTIAKKKNVQTDRNSARKNKENRNRYDLELRVEP